MQINLNTKMPFGKYKGDIVSDILPDDIDSDVEAKEFKSALKYFMWIDRKTDHVLSDELKDRMKEIFNKLPKPVSYSANSKSYSGLNHYNDIGAMNDLTFQDVYGDFGF